MTRRNEATEGPWVFGPMDCVWVAADIEFRDGKWRETCDSPRIVADPSNRADGRLIAAAPTMEAAIADLLEAEDAYDETEEADERIKACLINLRAALRAARGEQGEG